MTGTALLLLLAAAAQAQSAITVVAQAHAPFAGRALPNTELARLRGGLRLPNGLDVSLGIDIQTRIDGMLALHTVYASDGATPGVRVFTDGEKPVSVAPATATITTGSIQSAPMLVVDRSPTGTTIVPSRATAAATVNLVNGDPSTWLSGEGQEQIPVTPNGPAVAAAPGAVSLTSDKAGAAVTLRTPTLEIRQLIGQATGVVVANTANDRAIDTISSVNVDLQGLSPALISSTFAAQRAALEATLMR